MKDAYQKIIEKATYRSQIEGSPLVCYFDSDFREVGYHPEGRPQESVEHIRPIVFDPEFLAIRPMFKLVGAK